MISRFLAVLSLIYLSACAGNEARLDNAADARGRLKATRDLPDLPAYCRERSASGVRLGDRLDAALLKTDAALVAEHQRTAFCADWYDEVKSGFAAGKVVDEPQ